MFCSLSPKSNYEKKQKLSRVSSCWTDYLLGQPTNGFTRTIFLVSGFFSLTRHVTYNIPMPLEVGDYPLTCRLGKQIHGWPDLSIGWRNQIPLFLSLGFRVVCPDLMGYGGTDAPPVPPNESLKLYGYKRAADDINQLAKKLGATKILLGGHDWVSFIGLGQTCHGWLDFLSIFSEHPAETC